MMNSRIAISGIAFGSRIGWNLHSRTRSAAIEPQRRDAAKLLVVHQARPRAMVAS